MVVPVVSQAAETPQYAAAEITAPHQVGRQGGGESRGCGRHLIIMNYSIDSPRKNHHKSHVMKSWRLPAARTTQPEEMPKGGLRAFTLIELLVVIAIIAILAAL